MVLLHISKLGGLLIVEGLVIARDFIKESQIRANELESVKNIVSPQRRLGWQSLPVRGPLSAHLLRGRQNKYSLISH